MQNPAALPVESAQKLSSFQMLLGNWEMLTGFVYSVRYANLHKNPTAGGYFNMFLIVCNTCNNSWFYCFQLYYTFIFSEGIISKRCL